MEKLKVKKKLTRDEFIFLDKIFSNKPLPHSKQAEEVMLYYDEEKLKALKNKFGKEFNFCEALQAKNV